MRAMVLRGKDLSIEDVEKPTPGPGQVLARVLACGICGSDLHAAKYMEDMVANARRTRRDAWYDRDLSAGIVMGHEFVAEVVEAGSGTDGWTPGTRVTSMPVLIVPESPTGFAAIGYSPEFPGAYGEYVLMSAPMLLRVPDRLSNEVAATTEPCAVGLHAVRQGKVQPAEHALVMGAGPIGLMTLLWLKHDGIRHVTVSDPAPTRRELALRLGADLVVDAREQDVLDAMTDAVGSAPTVVFEAVGVEGTLQQAMETVERGGRVVVVGVCMKEDRIYPMVGINKQLSLQFVLGYTPEEYAETLQALGSGAVDTSPLITRCIALDDLPAAFESLADPSDCKVVLLP
jgi:2-desacetyl-2-hydroxyethyl bacteriochlorophyllide A dehydrogenase